VQNTCLGFFHASLTYVSHTLIRRTFPHGFIAVPYTTPRAARLFIAVPHTTLLAVPHLDSASLHLGVGLRPMSADL
jgi:hypothetical protein